MDNHFTLSVIIPVYNCERFIEKTIASVISQPEVIEIIVINDGSTDTTALLLDQLQKQNSILKIYHHQNKVNKGRSSSRNLGIQKATGNYIAFLDADDYFLQNRFTNDIKVFQENVKCDGVYNAIGAHFYKEVSILERDRIGLYMVTEKIKPEELFVTLFSGKKGHFSIDGLTVKKSVFDMIGFFNEALVVMEDTDIFWKMALKCNLFTGIIDQPVAIRGVHDKNVFDQADLYKKNVMLLYESLLEWCCKNKVTSHTIDVLLKTIWIIRFKGENKLYQDIGYWAKLFYPYPKLFFSILSIKYFPVIRLRKALFPFLYPKTINQK
ncbi:glycosyltransferase family 2 protein [Flavobacterium sp. DSP2-3-1]|uniref:glycosyltransferase family 2 protein n=1 Tax=Flavobacterium sp. DSP2-3-1 TaxID=2804620 RepID=UPI003CF41259